jgi:hypothetical protein
MNNKSQGTPTGGLICTRPAFGFGARSFQTIAAAAAALIHLSSAVNASYIQGEPVGERVFEHTLRPANAQQGALRPPTAAHRTSQILGRASR